jgi:hypothetical protein
MHRMRKRASGVRRSVRKEEDWDVMVSQEYT